MAEMIAVTLSAKFVATLSIPAAVQISSLAGIRSGIAAAARDLELLRAFLAFADSRRGTDALANAWVDQVRDVAFELEDVADEYAFLSGRSHIRDCANLAAWFGLSRRLRKARERLRDLSAAKEQYGIRPPAEASPSSSAAGGVGAAAVVIGRKQSEASHFVEEDEIVGFGAHRRLLMKWLTLDRNTPHMLITVCGMGGVGKTTLVTNVYKKVAESCYFDYTAWVAVSKSFTTDDLLRRIAKEFHRNVHAGVPWDVDKMDYRSLVETLRKHLASKRYLLLLDDVWDAQAWYDISCAFVNVGTSNRIIITTRNENVASLASSNRTIRLDPLSDQEAWSLFCNTTFREDADQECPYHLEQLAHEILDKCSGLPLAIVSVGKLLKLRKRTEFAWKNVLESLEWDGSNEQGIRQVSNILNLSIDDLPHHLQRCFLYCSIYPEDFLIKRKILIRKWVAQGLIEEKGNDTMEEVADDHLNQLVERNLLQVVLKNDFGRAKRCNIHDLIRDLIVHRSRKERFTVFSQNTVTLKPNNKIRHLILDRCRIHHTSATNMTSLRSFHAFVAHFDASLLSGFRLLTVLNLWFIQIAKLPCAVTNLLNLRYLGIRSTLIEGLPDELGQLHNLQTLDAKWSRVQRVPRTVTKLKSLRHLILFNRQSADIRYPGSGTAIGLPDVLENLTCLQTLKYIEANETTIRSLGSLKQMRSLELFGVDESNIVCLPSSISQMSCLMRLGIASQDDKVTFNLESFSPPPLKLQKLTLRGRLIGGKLPSWFGSLNHLMKLQLRSSELNEDAVSLLSSLPRLLHLSLMDAYNGKKLTFTEGCFPVLRKLILRNMPNLSRIEFRRGSLVDLQVLMLRECTKLTDVPQGIENLKCLTSIELFVMPRELVEKIQGGEDYWENHNGLQKTVSVNNIWWHKGLLQERKFYTDLSALLHMMGYFKLLGYDPLRDTLAVDMMDCQSLFEGFGWLALQQELLDLLDYVWDAHALYKFCKAFSDKGTWSWIIIALHGGLELGRCKLEVPISTGAIAFQDFGQMLHKLNLSDDLPPQLRRYFWIAVYTLEDFSIKRKVLLRTWLQNLTRGNGTGTVESPGQGRP
uniref:AAA+ ATPase domain-containing protein n=1 Tax=Leersia perrieri TaxID=77586 RepID=A0A0D9W8L4_9ORYZ